MWRGKEKDEERAEEVNDGRKRGKEVQKKENRIQEIMRDEEEGGKREMGKKGSRGEKGKGAYEK